MKRRTFLYLSAAAATLRVASSTAGAQAYLARPVRVIVPFAPGGQVDVVARLIAQRLSEQLGQQFYVENAAGVGTGAHLTGELFRISLGLDLVHVPYNSGGQAIAAAVGGHTPISFGSPAATIPQVNDGKLRALAVGGKKRVRELPAIPTMREVGFAEVECDTSILVLVPAGVPKDIIALLHDEIARAVALPDVEARLVGLGFEPFAATPDEVAALIKRELPKWAGVIRAAGIKPN